MHKRAVIFHEAIEPREPWKHDEGKHRPARVSKRDDGSESLTTSLITPSPQRHELVTKRARKNASLIKQLVTSPARGLFFRKNQLSPRMVWITMTLVNRPQSIPYSSRGASIEDLHL